MKTEILMLIHFFAFQASNHDSLAENDVDVLGNLLCSIPIEEVPIANLHKSCHTTSYLPIKETDAI